MEFFRDIYWYDPDLQAKPLPENAAYDLKGAQWYLRKEGNLVFMAKGGHNDEPHNHNDIGSFALFDDNKHPLEDPFVNEYLLTERIRIANVIVNCYAVLEELHMQIIADTKNPSVINGKWNPLVKEELCSRLARKSIDSQKSIPWLSRNGVIRPFRASAVEADALCEWSDGQAICDFKINICDAILELSYMRSQLASHKYGNKVFKLSVYDADNAFFLARYLLAKHLGRDICPSS